MRFGVWALVALIVGALLTHFLLEDRGYVLINFRGYRVEMSVPVLVFVAALAYGLIRIGAAVWRAPRLLGAAVAGRRTRRAGDALTRGLIRMTEGDWAGSEKQLTRGLKGSDAPLVNYLLAARAAQQRGALERRNEWLQLAFEQQPQAETAILQTQAELQFAAGEYESAVATLRRVLERTPNHPVALGLLAQTYYRLLDRRQLRAMLPQLHRASLPDALRETLVLTALDGAAGADGFDQASLRELWSEVPTGLRRQPSLICWRARTLQRLGAGAEAETELRAALKRDWDPSLVRTYGEVSGSDARKQLLRAERWLNVHPDDAALLLTAARLCLANELWGKARSYLESSLALAPEPVAYALYGKLLTQLGETENAANAYRSGLGMLGGSRPQLPELAVPETTAER